MEKLVQSFLSKNYEVNVDLTLLGHSIYPIGGKDFIYPKTLLSDLNTIFAVDEEDLKVMIESWGHSIAKDLDLTDWWGQIDYSFDSIAFPTRVMAHTIGQDLVSVQPMSASIGQLMYMDYQIVNNEPIVEVNRNGRVYNEETFRQSVTEMQQHYMVGELEHPTPNIEINLNDRNEDSAVYRTLQKWSNIIGISSRRSEE